MHNTIQAIAHHVRTLTDGTVRLILRLEGEAVEQPTVLSCSMFRGDLVLVEKVGPAPITEKIPVPPVEQSSTGAPWKSLLPQPPIVELSPSLLAPTV